MANVSFVIFVLFRLGLLVTCICPVAPEGLVVGLVLLTPGEGANVTPNFVGVDSLERGKEPAVGLLVGAGV